LKRRKTTSGREEDALDKTMGGNEKGECSNQPKQKITNIRDITRAALEHKYS